MQQEEDVVFRSTPRYWLIHFLPVFLVFILIPIILIIIFGMLYSVIFLGTSVFAILFYREEFSTALSAQVKINRQGITLLYQDEEKAVRWTDIRYIEAVRAGSRRGITLYGDDCDTHIPGRYFDYEELYQRIRMHLPAEASQPLAYRSTPEFTDWKAKMDEKFTGLTRTLKVDTGRAGRISGALLTVLGFLIAYGTLTGKIPGRMVWWVGAGLLVLAGLALAVCSNGWLAANPEKISLYRLFHRMEIRWEDVNRVEQNPETGQWVVFDRQTCLVIPSSRFWSGKDKRLLRQYLDYRMRLLAIPVEENPLTFLRISKKMAGS